MTARGDHFVSGSCAVVDHQRNGTDRSRPPFAPDRRSIGWRLVRALCRPIFGRAR